MYYATGGLALGRVNFSDFEFFGNNGQIFTNSSDQTKTGWTLGGGAEWAFAPRWSVKAKYLHVDLGSVSYTSIGSINPSNSIIQHRNFTEEIVRLGVNYKIF